MVYFSICHLDHDDGASVLEQERPQDGEELGEPGGDGAEEGGVARAQPDVGVHGSAKATKIESSCLNEIPLQMLPMGMWGPENMKIKKIRWGLFEFYIFLY